MHRVDSRENEWLIKNYATGTIHDTLDGFERKFGWRPTKQTIYQRAHKLGLRKQLQDPRIRNDKAQVRIVWLKEPEMEAWMLEHDTGAMQETIEAFEQHFGIRLSRGQVNLFRASHGTQKRDIGMKRRGGRARKPIGFERKTKGGILVKVAEEAIVPMSKDNWRYKHHLAYEKAYGAIPDDHQVFAVDGNNENCDPENLVAVPNRALGAFNSLKREGYAWNDRQGMIAVVNMALLRIGINDAEHRQTRCCGVCGREFVEPENRRRHQSRLQTCPECLAAGKKTKGDRTPSFGPKIKHCAICGHEFGLSTKAQKRCRSCINEHPRLGINQHKKKQSIRRKQ